VTQPKFNIYTIAGNKNILLTNKSARKTKYQSANIVTLFWLTL